jgi:L-alanine-DL-glutamate epimerase-like enolase superfamily enzyme
MLIDHIDVSSLRFEYPPEDAFMCAGGHCGSRVTTLIQVYTNTGHVGLGSVYSYPALVYLIIKQQLEPLLVGEDPTEVEALWTRMYRTTRWYGRKGVAMSALGGLDTAFWDLRGKAMGLPVWALLGGERASCPAYASALLWKELPALASEAAGHIARGFRRVKLRMARSEEYDREAVLAVRQAIGPQNELMADAGMRYNLPLAQRMGRFLAEQGIFWFEEPFQPEDLDSYAALRASVGRKSAAARSVRVAAGENEFGAQGFAELIRVGAVDIVQPDASRCGGISEVIKVARMAAAAGLEFATHTWNDAVAVMANAQVVSSMPNGLTVEVDQTGIPFIDELLVEPLTVRDGQLRLSQAPGLGIELDERVVARYRVADPLAIPDGFYSDMVFGKEHVYTPPDYIERP